MYGTDRSGKQKRLGSDKFYKISPAGPQKAVFL